MRVTLGQYTLTVDREPGDIRYPDTVGGESRLLYHIKQALQKQGLNVIKKRMWKDGHLVDDLQQYIRTRDGSIMIYDSQWAIRFTTEPFNQDGHLELAVAR